MNVPTITMDPEVAKAKLKAFRADLHKDTEKIYRETAAAYEHLAEGTPLLRLSKAFEQAGHDALGRPKIAICRSDRQQVKAYRHWRDDRLHLEAGPFNWNGNQTYQAATSPTLNMIVDLPWPHMKTGYAITPMVPADVRPKHGQLRNWFTLWEVDQWFDRPQGMKAPVDPMLLQPIGGDLYAVLATWDLTPIEQAILEGSLR